MRNIFTVDSKLLAESLRNLEKSTKDCSEDDLKILHQQGYIPTGILNWLLACSVKIC